MSVTQGTWNTQTQILTHQLSTSIINYHNTPDAVFDDENLKLLNRFTDDRTIRNRDAILREHGWTDDEGSNDGCGAGNLEGKVRRPPGSNAGSKGSLSGMMIARFGTEEPGFDERDWELLRGWFGRGMPSGEHVSR